MSHIYALCVSLHNFSEAWKFSLAFWVDHFCAYEPVTLVPCFPFPDPLYSSVRVVEITWQKQTGGHLGNITLSFVCFSSTFSSAMPPGSSSPLSVALFPFECSLFNVLRSPFSYAVVRIRSIPICHSREEEFWFLIQCIWHSLSASSLLVVTAPSPTSCSSDRKWIFTDP